MMHFLLHLMPVHLLVRHLGAVGRICASAADRANLVLPAGKWGKGWTISGDALSCSSPEINIKGNR